MKSNQKFRHRIFKNGPAPLLTAGAMVYAGTNITHAQYSIPAPMAPPVYTELRYNENWSYLKDPAARTNLVDPIKYIPLNKQGDIYLTIGGQERDRYEYFNNYQFGAGPQTPNGYNLIRLMLDADLHLGPYARIFVEGISATEQSRAGGPRASDENEADLYQAFVDFIAPISPNINLDIRAGRQVVIFGAQRLIGVSDFTNVRRTNDGVRGTLTSPGNTLDVFYMRPILVYPYDLDQETSGTYFGGVYDTWHVPGELSEADTKLEAYALFTQRKTTTYNEATGGEKRYTFGTRFTSYPMHFDFDLEPDYQFGLYNGEVTHAFSVAAIAGYTFANAPMTPRPFLGADIASGGSYRHPGDTFDQLFPSAHDQFGTMDVLGRQNIIDVHPGFTLNLIKDKPWVKSLTLLTQYRQFWRESDQDGVYTSSGTLLRAAPSGGSTATGLGSEVDIQVNWKLNRYFSAYTGYAHFFPGPYIRASGPDQSIDFAYTSVTFTF
jgi:hypothetical protein